MCACEPDCLDNGRGAVWSCMATVCLRRQANWKPSPPKHGGLLPSVDFWALAFRGGMAPPMGIIPRYRIASIPQKGALLSAPATFNPGAFSSDE